MKREQQKRKGDVGVQIAETTKRINELRQCTEGITRTPNDFAQQQIDVLDSFLAALKYREQTLLDSRYSLHLEEQSKYLQETVH